jgi:ribosomal protein S26
MRRQKDKRGYHPYERCSKAAAASPKNSAAAKKALDIRWRS